MKITFYGVRGSIATSGANTLKYGGHTSCTHVQPADGQHYVFDAGTGIRTLGREILGDGKPINILLTHNHWDHIQGFPFFEPNFEQGRHIHIASHTAPGMDRLPVFSTVSGPFHPVEFEDLSATFQQQVVAPEPSQFTLGSTTISTMPLNHPNGGSAYRMDVDGLSIAFVTDNELFPPQELAVTSYEEWVSFLKGVDVLVHDAQYVEADMPTKHGWGHSLISQVLSLASDAGVRALCLYSHDPDRSDAQLDQMQRDTRAEFQRRGSNLQVYFAAEGQTLSVSKDHISSN